MFVVQVPILEKILRTVFVYATILILFRLFGKRDLAVLNTFDFVVIFLLSNVVPSGQLILSLKPEEQNATKGDITHLNTRLDAIEAALATLAGSK
jgi:uncharacterized membrane protein YcaP (DUF421 family)